MAAILLLRLAAPEGSGTGPAARLRRSRFTWQHSALEEERGDEEGREPPGRRGKARPHFREAASASVCGWLGRRRVSVCLGEKRPSAPH